MPQRLPVRGRPALALALCGALAASSCNYLAYDVFDPDAREPDDGNPAAQCDGVDTTKDAGNCGACGRQCGGTTCSAGECAPGALMLSDRLRDRSNNPRRLATYLPVVIAPAGDTLYLVGGDGDQTGMLLIAKVVPDTGEASVLYLGSELSPAPNLMSGGKEITAAAAGGWLYLHVGGDGGDTVLWRLKLDGTSTGGEAVNEGVFGFGVLADDLYVVYGDKSVRKTSAASPDPTGTTLATLDELPARMLVTSKGLFFGFSSQVAFVPLAAGSPSVSSTGEGGGAPRFLSLVPQSHGKGADALVWLDRNGKLGSLALAAFGSGTGSFLQDLSSYAPTAYVSAVRPFVDTRVIESYLVTGSTSGAGLLLRSRSDANGGNPVEIGAAGERAQSFALTDRRLYWMSVEPEMMAVSVRWVVR